MRCVSPRCNTDKDDKTSVQRRELSDDSDDMDLPLSMFKNKNINTPREASRVFDPASEMTSNNITVAADTSKDTKAGKTRVLKRLTTDDHKLDPREQASIVEKKRRGRPSKKVKNTRVATENAGDQIESAIKSGQEEDEIAVMADHIIADAIQQQMVCDWGQSLPNTNTSLSDTSVEQLPDAYLTPAPTPSPTPTDSSGTYSHPDAVEPTLIEQAVELFPEWRAQEKKKNAKNSTKSKGRITPKEGQGNEFKPATFKDLPREEIDTRVSHYLSNAAADPMWETESESDEDVAQEPPVAQEPQEERQEEKKGKSASLPLSVLDKLMALPLYTQGDDQRLTRVMTSQMHPTLAYDGVQYRLRCASPKENKPVTLYCYNTRCRGKATLHWGENLAISTPRDHSCEPSVQRMIKMNAILDAKLAFSRAANRQAFTLDDYENKMKNCESLMSTRKNARQTLLRFVRGSDVSSRRINAGHCYESTVAVKGSALVKFCGLGLNDMYKHIVVLATPFSLSRLGQALVLFIDGTYWTCPLGFAQVLRIGYLDSDGCFRDGCIALLTRHVKQQYIAVLGVIRALLPGWSGPRLFIMDMEVGLANAARHHWPGIDLNLCFFHTRQTLRRRYEKVVGKKWRLTPAWLEYRKGIVGLFFIRPDLVAETFEQLGTEYIQHLPQIQAFHDYFYRNFVRDSSRFAVCDWNLHTSVIADLPITSNQLETVHRVARGIYTCHPSTAMFIARAGGDFTKQEEKVTKTFRNARLGLPEKKRSGIVADGRVKIVLGKEYPRESLLSKSLRIGKAVEENIHVPYDASSEDNDDAVAGAGLVK